MNAAHIKKECELTINRLTRDIGDLCTIESCVITSLSGTDASVGTLVDLLETVIRKLNDVKEYAEGGLETREQKLARLNQKVLKLQAELLEAGMSDADIKKFLKD